MSDFMYTPDEQRKINNIVNDCVDSYRREESEKHLRKELFEDLKDEVPITKALFNALVKERFDESSTKAVEKHEDIIQLDEILLRANTSRQDDTQE